MTTRRDTAITAACVIGSAFLAWTAVTDWRRRNDYKPSPKLTPPVGPYGDLYKADSEYSSGHPVLQYERPATRDEAAAAILSEQRGCKGLFGKITERLLDTQIRFVMPDANPGTVPASGAGSPTWYVVLGAPDDIDASLTADPQPGIQAFGRGRGKSTLINDLVADLLAKDIPVSVVLDEGKHVPFGWDKVTGLDGTENDTDEEVAR